MSGILVDRRGRAWSENSWELARRLGARSRDGEIVRHAVCERGWIHLAYQRDGARVALRAGKFTQKTLLGALLSLERFPSRILLSTYDGARWSHAIFGSIASFAEHAEDIAADRPYGKREPWLATGLGLEGLLRPRLAPLQPVLRLWQASRGRLSEDLFATIEALGLGGRAVLLRREPATRRLVHEQVPTGVPYMAPCQWLHLIGREVEDLPDQRYGAWATRTYHDVLAQGEPRLDSVRAMIGVMDGSTLRSRYDRLVLPWRHSGNDQFVSVVSVRRELSIAPSSTAALMSESRISRA